MRREQRNLLDQKWDAYATSLATLREKTQEAIEYIKDNSIDSVKATLEAKIIEKADSIELIATRNELDEQDRVIKESVSNIKVKVDEIDLSVKEVQHTTEELTVIANEAANNASDAFLEAQVAMGAIGDMSNDAKLTPLEKQATKKEWEIIYAEKPMITSEAGKHGVDYSWYVHRYNALNTYVLRLLQDMTTTSDINGNSFREYFSDYYSRRQEVLNMISSKTKENVDKKPDKNEIIASINISKEEIRINAEKLSLEGMVTVTDLAGNGSVEINAGNIIAGGTIEAVGLYGCGIRGTTDFHMEPGSTSSFDGVTYIRKLNIVKSHQGWEPGMFGEFHCNPEAWFYDDAHFESRSNFFRGITVTDGNVRINGPGGNIDLGGEASLYLGDKSRYISKNGSKDLTIGCLGGSIYLRPGNTYGNLLFDQRGYFYPVVGHNWALGHPSYKFSSLYVGTVVQDSDVNSKENVSYLGSDLVKPFNTDITLDDCYDFVKDSYKVATYDYKYKHERDKKDFQNQIGFIAQDIKDHKVAKYLIRGNETDGLMYSSSCLTGIAMAGLQVASKKIEALEAENKALKKDIAMIKEKLGLS